MMKSATFDEVLPSVNNGAASMFGEVTSLVGETIVNDVCRTIDGFGSFGTMRTGAEKCRVTITTTTISREHVCNTIS